MASDPTVYVELPAPVAIVATATRSLLLLNPATSGFRVTEVGVSFDAAAVAPNARLQLYRTVTLGAPVGVAATGTKPSSPGEATTSTALHTLTTEPTSVEVLRQWLLQPFGGPYVFQYPLGREPAAASGGGRIGLRYISPAGLTVPVHAYIEIEE